jgi:non-lysosomal glucosylceramidase
MNGVALRYAYRQQEIAEGKSEKQLKTFEDPLTFAIGGRPGSVGDVTYRTRFVTSGDGADVWMDFCDDGRLDNIEDDRPSAAGETIGAALAVTVRVPAGESREISFTLAWDMPRVRFGAGTAYYRQYTRFYGTYGTVSPKMAYDALFFSDEWEEKVERWQGRILQQGSLPLWYRGALFNELYFLVDGGAVWCYPTQGTTPDREVGHFAYLESHEYPMYNTYDVHFYASFALVQLWPKLELALQRDMAAATLAEYPDTLNEIYSGKRGRRKLYGCVPHDIGWPDEDPWKKVNGYPFHDVNHWKDLNPKFVLQIYRDYLVTGDKQFLRDTWEAVEAAIRRANRFDRDGDGLIENDGVPDQTYDVWSVKGPSAYTGGLWLACLSAGAELAKAVGEKELEAEYRRILAKGKQFYEKKLWNGHYYNYDSSSSPQHDSIMADQLAGQWYARACGLPPIVDPEHAKSALTAIYKLNVMHFNNGQMGAVNGMRPDGRPDTTSLQSQEVWSGTSYSLAAALIQESLCEEGYATAQGVYKMTYEKTGYWFQTPEAWDAQGNARAVCYMRPLAIWAMQWAIDRRWERAR